MLYMNKFIRPVQIMRVNSPTNNELLAVTNPFSGKKIRSHMLNSDEDLVG